MKVAHFLTDITSVNFNHAKHFKIRKEPVEYFSFASNSFAYLNKCTSLSVYFVSSGQVEFCINDLKTFTCHQSNFVVVNKGTSIKYVVKDVQATDIVTFYFTRCALETEVIRNGQPQSASFSAFGNSLLSALCKLSETGSVPRYHLVESDVHLTSCLLEHLKYDQELANRILSRNRNTRHEIFAKVCKAREYILKSLTQPISLKCIASEVGMSKYHFNRCFSAAFSVPPLKYMLEMRLQTAMQLIKNEQMPLSEIPIHLQFTDFSYFSNQFKNRFGIRPSLLYRDRITDFRLTSRLLRNEVQN